ncbi:molecular chaperone DnaK, partial [Patescibacteria group bacterium]|nr:molecular chaperone DnaK [Patescibacteria group bacterium]MBU1629873.1 molecular chaperone DnaK [Patescibacteria group bacterium]MBU1907958.1 molecular chaperone DnaK [Patescibacteria group bacterium]
QAVVNPENTLFSVKRLIGRRWNDAEVQRDVKWLPYKVVQKGDGVRVVMNGKEYASEEISAMVLQKMKTDAEAKIGEKITEAVITVPAYFDDSQRQATKVAGEIAGLKVSRIINEPTAAALAYGFDRKKDEKIVVYDLGGGTFDVSVLEIAFDTATDQNTVEVRATNGDTHLGGDDFDQVIIRWIVEEFKKQEGIDLSKDVLAIQRIKEAAEKAKIELSSAVDTEINQPFITSDANGPKHMLLKLSRAKLEELVSELVEKTLEPCKKALADAGMKTGDINEIIMVGGMTRMPLVQSAVEKFFGKKLNVTVNPDEVVAIGAAVQAGNLQGDIKGELLLLDVTPLSLGLETLGGVMTKLIERNTTVPTSKSQIFSTAADGQTSVEIHVLQGEREIAEGNRSLGRFTLSGIPVAPRGIPQVEVTFDIDANGILSVKAEDKATKKEQKITITATTNLSDEEIEKMKKDAEAHVEEDRKRHALVEARNMAESMIYTTEKMLKEAGDPSKSTGQAKISDEDKKAVEEKIEALKKLKDTEDVEAMKKAGEELAEAAQKIGAAMYEQSKQAAGNAEQGAPEEPKEESKEEPKEGEFEEKK